MAAKKNDRYEAVEALIGDHFQAGYFTKAVCGVFDRDGIIYKNTWGEVRTDTVFDLASLTKIYTTTLFLDWIDRGSVKLEEALAKYIKPPKECPGLRQIFRGLTLRQLLTHTGGLMAWYPFYTETEDFYRILEKITEAPLVPGYVVYSDLNYMLLGKAAEAISGLPLKQAMEETMSRLIGSGVLSYYPPESRKAADIAASSHDNAVEEGMCRERGLWFSGFRPHGAAICGEANDGNCWYYFKGVSGHAGLFSDLDGVCNLGRFFLNAKSSIYVQAQQAAEGTRGLGFEVGDTYPEGCGHTGFTGTSLYVSRENGIGAVLLTDRLNGKANGGFPNLGTLRKRLHETVLACSD